MLPKPLLPLLPLLFVAPLAFAVPTLPQTEDHPSFIQTSWLIPRLDMHFMTPDTGLPGNPPWPAQARFDSTIDFDFDITEGKVRCRGAWPNGTLPAARMLCEDAQGRLLEDRRAEWGKIEFGMEPWTELGGNRRPEMAYTLSVYRALGERQLVGSANVSGNKIGEPTSYLTCLLGRPMDGLRCKIHSYLSTTRELILNATEVETMLSSTGSV